MPTAPVVLTPLDPSAPELMVLVRMGEMLSRMGLYALDTGIAETGLSNRWYCLACSCTTVVNMDRERVFEFTVDSRSRTGLPFDTCSQAKTQPPRCRCHVLPSIASKGAGSLLWRGVSARKVAGQPVVSEPVAEDSLAAAMVCSSCWQAPPDLLWVGTMDGSGPLLGWYCGPCVEITLPVHAGEHALEEARVFLETRVALGMPPASMASAF